MLGTPIAQLMAVEQIQKERGAFHELEGAEARRL